MSFPLNESQGKNRFYRSPQGGIEQKQTRTGPSLADAVLAPLPEKLLHALAAVSGRRRLPLYFSGGVVRDWLLGLVPADVDITIATGALAFARELAATLGAAFVPLSPEEGVARVVWGEFCLDISQFREGTASIEADLGRRDFSVNAMAVGFDSARRSLANGGLVIDPLGGLADLADGVIRLAHPKAFAADPLRMLRAYRFRAAFAWLIEPLTQAAIVRQATLISRVSGERIAVELDKILACGQCYPTIQEMVSSGLLFQLFPELAHGVGLLQPSSHHLDVFSHSLETLRQIERVIHEPSAFFPAQGGTDQDPSWGHDISVYLLSAPRQTVRLKYAALFHDLGKTTTCAEKKGRITFYNHDEAGVALLEDIAGRLHWSNEDTRRIRQLVKQHMWPFHLHNAKRQTGITPRAILKLVKAAGEDLIGLFLLVMADSLAGQGTGKPEGMEEGVAALFAEVYQTYQVRLKPIMDKPLLTGHDLIQTLHLTPGPVFKQILDALLEERAVEPGMTKDRALAWAKDYAARLEKK